jgi:DNA-binding MarR family transcriptional regulator
MATQSPLRQEIQAKFSKGVKEADIPKVAEEIAKKLQKKPSIVKALITRYINKGLVQKKGDTYVWVGE